MSQQNRGDVHSNARCNLGMQNRIKLSDSPPANNWCQRLSHWYISLKGLSKMRRVQYA